MNDSLGNVLTAGHEIVDATVKVRYLEFMRKRFLVKKGNYTSEDYALEWASRFKNDTPENHMDNGSKAIYYKIREQFR